MILLLLGVFGGYRNKVLHVSNNDECAQKHSADLRLHTGQKGTWLQQLVSVPSMYISVEDDGWGGEWYMWDAQ